MNAMYLIYVPVAVFFVVFVAYAGLVMPAKEITESLRGDAHDRDDGDVVEFPARDEERERVAA
ncbi:hypothetical protein [Actinomadura hibisca]|uniref:hypothetical protein n=1 Tax=Actinomadura hibisca TaxID=68565 RepID=UPI000835E5FF|nr:hypothetical protein [Actinomadura hibisca]